MKAANNLKCENTDVYKHKLHGLAVNSLDFKAGFYESTNPFQNVFRNFCPHTQETNTHFQIVDKMK